MLTNEMVFAIENEKITSGGYDVDSTFLNNGIPISYTLNKKSFGGLSVPSGLLYMSNNSKMSNELNMTGGTIERTVDDGLYNKLFELAKMDSKNKINHNDSSKEDHDEVHEVVKTSSKNKTVKNKPKTIKTKPILNKSKKHKSKTKRLYLRPGV
jgi:hypothetical protein